MRNVKGEEHFQRGRMERGVQRGKKKKKKKIRERAHLRPRVD